MTAHPLTLTKVPVEEVSLMTQTFWYLVMRRFVSTLPSTLRHRMERLFRKLSIGGFKTLESLLPILLFTHLIQAMAFSITRLLQSRAYLILPALTQRACSKPRIRNCNCR